MKASELRLGNYVKGYNSFGELIFTVRAIDDDEIAIGKWTNYIKEDGKKTKGRSYMKLKGIHPIPITEQWLLDFGYVTLDCEQNYVEWGNPDGIECFKFHIQQDGIGKSGEYPFYFRYDIGFGEQQIELKHVHQLQNLYFALTGEELTIKEKV